MQTPASHSRHFASAAIIFAVVCAVYYPVLQNTFVWDDISLLQVPTAYGGLQQLLSSALEPLSIYPAYYRPLVQLSFAAYPAGAPNAALVQHGLNLFLHACSAVLVYFCIVRCIARTLGAEVELQPQTRRVALGFAVLFALHPIANEPVAWVSGRFDLALTLLCCLFVYIDLGHRSGARRLTLLAVTYFLAASSKETAVAFPIAVLLLHTLLWRVDNIQNSWGTYLWSRRSTYVAILIGGTAYMILRWVAMNRAPLGELPLQIVEMTERPFLASLALLSYIKLLFLPWLATGPFHAFDLAEYSTTFKIAISLLTFAGIIVLSFLATTRRLRWPLVVFIALSMLLPVLHIASFSAAPTLYADRYALTPLALGLIASSPLLAESASRLHLTRAAAMAYGSIAVVIVISWVALARVTTQLWRDDLSLWSYAYTVAPKSAMATSNYFYALLTAGRIEAAEAVAQQIKARGIGSLIDLRNIAAFYATQGNFDAAYQTLRSVDVYRTGRVNNTERASFFCGWAQIDVYTRRWADALEHSEAGIALKSSDLECKLIYARALTGAQRYSEAKALLSQLQTQYPTYQNSVVDQLLSEIHSSEHPPPLR